MKNRIEHMEFEEKIGQLIMPAIESDSVDGELISLIAFYHIGGVLLELPQKISAKQLGLMNRYLQYYSTNQRPLFIATNQPALTLDTIEGPYTMPVEDKLYEMNNRLYTRRLAELVAYGYRKLGINMMFYPNLTVHSETKKAIREESKLVYQHGLAALQGISAGHVVPCVNGFPSLHTINHEINASQYASKLYPFYELMKHHLRAIKLIDSDTATIHFLREELGFKQLIIYELEDNALSVEHTVNKIIEALNAGIDFVILPYPYEKQLAILNELISLGKKGHINESRLNQSLEKVYALKEAFQLHDLTKQTGLEKHPHYVRFMKETINQKLSMLS